MPLTHRLASKIEETPTVGSGNWNKVTVCIPNNTYILSKVKLQNNQLSVVFDFTDATNYQPAPFAFLLSGFGINVSLLNDNTKYLVIGTQSPNDTEREDSINSFPEWYDDNNKVYKKRYVLVDQGNYRAISYAFCPPGCPVTVYGM